MTAQDQSELVHAISYKVNSSLIRLKDLMLLAEVLRSHKDIYAIYDYLKHLE